MAEAENEEQENVIDDYELVNLITAGNATQIWEVKEQGGTNTFVMKRLLPDQIAIPEAVATIKLEAKVGKVLDHPNLIALHNFTKTKKNVYLLMDYFRAPNLRTQLSSDILSVQSRLRKLIESTAMGLGHMHEKGWVHKDIKPENILISKSSEVKVIDFGLAVPLAKGIGKMFGKPKSVQGTRSYIAPETIKKQPLDQAADIYSLGITIFEVLTGKTPFHGENPKEVLLKHISERPVPPSSINLNVTPECDEFVLKMLAKKPANRFGSMDEVVSSLRNLKLFKADISEIIAQNKEEADQAEKESMQEKRLDSRADARLSEMVKEDPEMAAELIAKRKEAAKAKADKKAELESKTKQKPSQKPPQPQQPPQPQPQYPPQPMPGGYQPQPMPGGYPHPPQYQQPMYPPQPMPGQPVPGQPMPGQPVAGQPQPMMYPPQQPGQPMPPGAHLPPGTAQQPPAGTPQQQTPVPPPEQSQAPQPQQTAEQVEDSKKTKNDDDLPFMDELPDVI